MSVDEHELRQRLTSLATQASAPRLTVDTLVRTIRRRRARIIGAVFGSLLAVAALLAAALAGFSGASRPSVPAHQPPPAIWLSFTLTINGQSHVIDRGGVHPRYVVTPGENTLIVEVTVPPRETAKALWLGITRGTWGGGPAGPTGLNPILLHVSKPISAGPHTFRLQWSAPAVLRTRTQLYLVAMWIAGQSEPAPIIAELVVSRGHNQQDFR